MFVLNTLRMTQFVTSSLLCLKLRYG